MSERYRSLALDVAVAALCNLGRDSHDAEQLPPIVIDVPRLRAWLCQRQPCVRAALLTDRRFVEAVLAHEDLYEDVVLPVQQPSP